MANVLLMDLINGDIELKCFTDWLSGIESKVINPQLNRAEFALHVLNYVQGEANKLLNVAPSKLCNTVGNISSLEGEPLQTVNSEERKKSEPARTPMRILNTSSPSKVVNNLLENCPQSRNIQGGAGPDTSRHRNSFSGSVHGSSDSGGRLLTSTPVTSPDSSCNSYSHTPQSRAGSHRNSPTFSPLSPQYSDSFPEMGARGRRRQPQSPNLGDFVITKPSSQKNWRRIKPTQLTTIVDKESTSGSKLNDNKFGTTARPFIPINSSQTEYKKVTSYDEERNLMKQKRNQSVIIMTRPPSQRSSCSETSVEDRLMVEERLQESGYNGTTVTNATPGSSPAGERIITIHPDPSLVTNTDKTIRLASIYCSCLDHNLIPNIISELFFIFSILTACYRHLTVINNSSTSKNTCYKEATSKDNVKRNIDFESPNNSIDKDKSERLLNGYNENLALTNELEENNKELLHKVSILNLCDLKSDTSAQSNNSESFSYCNSPPVIFPNDKETDKNGRVLNTPHNCVMFAACVIKGQMPLIQCLDKAVIRMLIENHRLTVFVPTIIPQLTQIMKAKEVPDENISPSKSLSNGPILYQSETDSQDNFSSLNSFNVFKKQRDVFYVIVCEWEEKHADSHWIHNRFPQRVAQLLAMSSDPVNMVHLARLFCAQLTTSKVCREEDVEVEIPGVPRDKLSLLKARLSKPAEPSMGPRPLPHFPPHHQLFLNFLKVAKGSTFLTHVMDCLIHKINLLDSSPPLSHGSDGEEHVVKKWVSELCVLGKFLGYLVFAPYMPEDRCLVLPPDSRQAQLVARQSTVAPLDVMGHLKQALANQQLVITLPWIVAYLGMMDPVAPFLPCYRSPLHLLGQIYISLPHPQLTPLASFLIRSCVGWLFDPAFFPIDLFYIVVSPASQLNVNVKKCVGADSQTVVDQALVSELCPAVASLRAVLASTAETKPRHITPVPAFQPLSTPPVSPAHTLQLQLEESFLHGQSASFRATVDFVVDRMSSSCIKYICSHVIAPIKQEAVNELKVENINKNEWKKKWCGQLGERVELALREHCGPPLLASLMGPLLGPDVPVDFGPTLTLCARRCHHTVTTWLNSHFNFTEMLCQLKVPQDVPVSDESRVLEHRDTVRSPPDMIIQLQDKLCQCTEAPNGISSEQEVLGVIKSTGETLRYREDLTSPARSLLYRLSVDLTIMLMAHKPSLVTERVQSELCQLWTLGPTEDQFLRIVSPRNALLLCQGGSRLTKESWNRLSELLVLLVKSELVTPNQLQQQWVSLLKLEWPRNVLAIFGACLKSMLCKLKDDPIFTRDPKLVLILEWVKEMTEELADEYLLSR